MTTPEARAELERRLRNAHTAWEASLVHAAESGEKLPWHDFIEYAAAYLMEHGIRVYQDRWERPL